jgi:AraC family transcriptional regulator
MLICNLSDLAAKGSAARDLLKSRWGRESCILWGRTSQATFGPATHTLSVRAAWGGQEFCRVGARTLAVDDDNFLIVNHGQIYSTSIDAPRGMESLAICFSPELIEQLHTPAEVGLDPCHGSTVRTATFFENLHPHERAVSPILQRIRSELAHGVADDAWFEDQLVQLLTEMQRHHAGLLRRLNKLPLVHSTARARVYRTIASATDFLHSHYTQDIDLGSIAKAAGISKYHFARLFTLVHGIPPYGYLQRKRINAAIRLLQSSALTTREVAAAVGFREHSTFMRQLRWSGKQMPGRPRPLDRAMCSE